MKVFVFSVEGFWFFKFYEKEAKLDFKRGLFLAQFKEFGRGIRGQKLVKLLEKKSSNFASLLFWGKAIKLFANLLKYKEYIIKVSVGIKFRKGMLTSCVLDSLTSMIEFL